MKRCKIKVYDYGSILHPIPRNQMPVCYEVEANCVGGEEGVFAVFEHPSFPEGCVGLAGGDDGHWWLTDKIHKSHIKGIIAAYQGIEVEEPVTEGDRKEMEKLLNDLMMWVGEAIEHVGSYNGRGRETEAKSMVSDPEDALMAKIRGNT